MEIIKISKHEYNELLEAKRFLEALECAGVENWEGYSYAKKIFYNEIELD